MFRAALLLALMAILVAPATAQTVRQAHNDARLIGTWKATQDIDAACSIFSGNGSFEITRQPDERIYRLLGRWHLSQSFKRGCRPQRGAPRQFAVDVMGRCAVAGIRLTCETHFRGDVTILRAKRSLWTIGRNSLELAETTPEDFSVKSRAKRWSTNVRGEVASLPLPLPSPPPGGANKGSSPPGDQERSATPSRRAYITWLERYAAAHHWLLTALDGLAAMDHNSAALFEQTLSLEVAKQERQDGDQALSWILDAHGTARPEKAATGDPALDAAADQGLDSLRPLEAAVRQAATDSAALFTAVLAHQATTANVAIRLRQGQKTRLRAEIAFWRLRTAGLPVSHPELHLHRASGAASAALIELYDSVLARLGASGRSAADVVAGARQQLAAGRRAISEGRRTTNQALAAVQGNTTLGNDARRQLFLGLATYAQSFDVEDQVLEALASAVDDLAAGRTLGQTLEGIATLAAKRRHHAHRRLLIIRRLAGYER